MEFSSHINKVHIVIYITAEIIRNCQALKLFVQIFLCFWTILVPYSLIMILYLPNLLHFQHKAHKLFMLQTGPSSTWLH